MRMLSLLMGLGAASVNDRDWLGIGRIALAEWNVDFLLGHDHNRSDRNPSRLARLLDDQRRHAKGRFIRNPTLPGVLADDGFVPPIPVLVSWTALPGRRQVHRNGRLDLGAAISTLDGWLWVLLLRRGIDVAARGQ